MVSLLCRAAFLLLVVPQSYVVGTPDSAQSTVPSCRGHNIKKKNVGIILGSTRDGRLSKIIADELFGMASTRTDIILQIIDIEDYQIPFLKDSVSPASRQTIIDPHIKKWSEKIQEIEAFVVVVPEYNAGYPGVLKNALDSLYVEWHGKPVAFVAYSGGPSGGAGVIDQLKTVVRALKMIPVGDDITIPHSWKALDPKGHFVDATIGLRWQNMLSQLNFQLK